MKLLIITSIQEDLEAVSRIMEKSGITVFSVTETIGHKTENHSYFPGNWFGKTEEGTNALFIFSFTEDDRAYRAIELVKEKNKAGKTGFPIRAFLLPVEQSGY